MPLIMSTLIFQHSRRQVIASMLAFVDGHDIGHDGTSKHDALIRAIKSADTQIEKMEYWSDVREAEHRGESMGTAEKVMELDPPAGPGDAHHDTKSDES